MRIAVTGTPGTGKTSVAEVLAERLDYDYVDVNAYTEHGDVETEEDGERGATAVDVDSLADAVDREVGEDAVLDGHLSHHVPADLVVVLRCDPAELEHRLEGKGWSGGKVQENVEAEALDIVLQEAVEAHDRVMEVDTTGRDATEVAETVADAAESIPDRLTPGHVAWDVEEYVNRDA